MFKDLMNVTYGFPHGLLYSYSSSTKIVITSRNKSVEVAKNNHRVSSVSEDFMCRIPKSFFFPFLFYMYLGVNW